MTATVADLRKLVQVKNLKSGFGKSEIVHGISLDVTENEVVALIGPSGCGKSTFIRCLNRLHQETSGAWVQGEVLVNGQNIYGAGVDPVEIRRRIGMVFQKPNPFPAMSIYDNVAAGLTLQSNAPKRAELDSIVERSLLRAALWNDVKDKLKSPGASLSGGQQQRLCIARALAVDPAVLLMDEPTSALDPISTAKIEELLATMKKEVTVIMVTHNMQQARRISDKTAFFLSGELIEFAPTKNIFTNPREAKTEAYVTGRFG
jgi:phosphate transport system ATP-binding protein